MNEPTVPALQEKEENGVNAEASSAGDQTLAAEDGRDPQPAEEAVPAIPDREAPDEKVPEIGSPEERGTEPGDGSAAVSVLAGLVGCIAGTLLCAAGGGMASTPGRFLFLLIPLAIGAANLLFRGSRKIPALVITAVFSLLGVFLVPSLTAAAAAAGKQGLSLLSVPLIALSRIGTANYFTDLALDSAHVFPVVFAVIGVLIAWEAYRLRKN